jgi:2-polyprenyl-3-methyl-5-hydroxy-6-metoxy-1,4-benzoquinol methylase
MQLETEKSFWQNFWGKTKLPQKVDYNFKNDRVIANTISKYIVKQEFNKSAIEIGCAPGKWLVFLNKELGYLVDGIEYVESAVEATNKNLILCEVDKSHFNITEMDFLKEEGNKKYDLVLSLGFIEHFINFDEIFKKHYNYLKEGGYLIIGFPNFRGLNYCIQKTIDSYSELQLIKNHNLEIMSVNVLKKLALDNNLKIQFLNYIGGFEPALFGYNAMKNSTMRYLIKKIIALSTVLFGNRNYSFSSSYILGIFKRENATDGK